MGGAPQRTCIACRRTTNRDDLLRFVLDPDGRLVLDLSRRLPGRGAHVCMTQGCLQRALDRNLFSRAFKRSVTPVDPKEYLEEVRGAIHRRILNLVSLANRSGMVISGSDVVESGLRSLHDPEFLLITRDTSPDRSKQFATRADARSVPVIIGFTSDEIGAVLGKESRNIVLFRRNGLTRKLHEELTAYREFNGIKGVQET